jgi:hypothetical protein
MLCPVETMKFFNMVHVGVLLSSLSIGLAQSCRYLPGDIEWPTIAHWKALNATVGGRLIATVPLGSPCHDPTYDAAKCAFYQSQWQSEPIQ